MLSKLGWVIALTLAAVPAAGCKDPGPQALRVSGHVEATEVRIAAEVGGRIEQLRVQEGDKVAGGDVIARLSTTDASLRLEQLRAERRGADAQVRLLQAGARPEEIRQAEAQLDAASADETTAAAELKAAQPDLDRFEALLAARAGSVKQRDDAKARVDVARGRVSAAGERVRVARENVARTKAGARPQEIEAARARVAAADALIASLENDIGDADVRAPASGVVTQKLVNQGELVAPRVPIVILTDLDHAWANLFVPEPVVPQLRLGQEAVILTDAGGPGIRGKLTYISPKAEFTPRNVQTADERSKLVYRVKVTVDNTNGTLKQGMPVDAEFPGLRMPEQP